jgi:hypothetical protein
MQVGSRSISVRRCQGAGAAVREVFGSKALIQRGTLHKRRKWPTTCQTRRKAWVDQSS